MKFVHSAATLSHVHSNIWMMTVLSVPGPRVDRERASGWESGAGRPSTSGARPPRATNAASLNQFGIGKFEARPGEGQRSSGRNDGGCCCRSSYTTSSLNMLVAGIPDGTRAWQIIMLEAAYGKRPRERPDELSCVRGIRVGGVSYGGWKRTCVKSGADTILTCFHLTQGRSRDGPIGGSLRSRCEGKITELCLSGHEARSPDEERMARHQLKPPLPSIVAYAHGRIARHLSLLRGNRSAASRMH